MTHHTFINMNLREIIYYREDGKCEVCKKIIPITQMQLAHRIAKTRGFHKKGTILQVKKRWMEKYNIKLSTTEAENILDHPLNLACTCSLRCNAAVLITGDPEASNKLLNFIYEDIK